MNGAVGATGALSAHAVIARIGDEFMMPAGAAARAAKSVTEAAQFDASHEASRRAPIGGRQTATSGARVEQALRRARGRNGVAAA